jgi:hypothetical protein
MSVWDGEIKGQREREGSGEVGQVMGGTELLDKAGADGPRPWETVNGGLC